MMNNAVLRIFRKDARRLWPHCAVAVAMIALAAVNNQFNPARGQLQSMVELLTPLACWMVAISAVHEERLVGDKQYWLTRPFSWKPLLAEKALFLLVFINLPLLMFQCVGMAMAGFSPLDWVSALIWRQVFVTIFFIIPAVAAGAVTKNLGQVVVAAVAAYLGTTLVGRLIFGGHRVPNWGSLQWMIQCEAALVILFGAAAVIALQYARRRTALAASLLGGVLLVCFATLYTPVWSGAFKIQELFSREPASAAQVRLSVDQLRIGSQPTQYSRGSRDPAGVRLEIPLDAAVPPGLRLAGGWSSLRIDSSRGSWNSGWVTFGAFHSSPAAPKPNVQPAGDAAGPGGWLTAYVPSGFYEANNGVAVRLSGTVNLALFRQVAKIRPSETAQIPRTGACKFLADGQCYAPARRFTISEVPPDGEPNFDSATLAPFPMEVGFQAVDRVIRWGQWLSPQPVGWDIYISRPVAYVQRSFEARNVLLSSLYLERYDQ